MDFGPYAQAIATHLGKAHPVVRDNVAEDCNVGIYVDPRFPSGIVGTRQYAVLDNVAPEANPTVVATHPVVRKAGNLP